MVCHAKHLHSKLRIVRRHNLVRHHLQCSALGSEFRHFSLFGTAYNLVCMIRWVFIETPVAAFRCILTPHMKQESWTDVVEKYAAFQFVRLIQGKVKGRLQTNGTGI